MSVPAISQPTSAVRRVPLLRRCVLQRRGRQAVGVVCNLSVGGIYVAIEPTPRLGEQLRLLLELPWQQAAMVLDAVVCWDNSAGRAPGLPPGCGLEFLALSWDDRARLEALVREWTAARSAARSRSQTRCLP